MISSYSFSPLLSAAQSQTPFGIAMLPWFLVGLSGLLCYLLMRQNGRILLRLDALEEAARASKPSTVPPKAPRPGLAVGTEAPHFELADFDGGRHALADYRGRKLVLIFFNPRCGHCMKMVPQLARLDRDGAEGQPTPIIIASGEAASNRKALLDAGVRCRVLLQEAHEVSTAYQTMGTPMGYLISGDGTIASPIAAGEPNLMRLLGIETPAPDPSPAKGALPSKASQGTAKSKLKRDGLKPGTKAPDFKLPLIDASKGSVSLKDYRGRQVLLVFSDPDCGPCQVAAPLLERIHRQRNALDVLMISRKDAEANRAKAEELGLTFPIALQKGWEVSKDYAMFATPIAYLIDEDGGIAAPVAKGVDAILRLAMETTGAPVKPRLSALETRSSKLPEALTA